MSVKNRSSTYVQNTAFLPIECCIYFSAQCIPMQAIYFYTIDPPVNSFRQIMDHKREVLSLKGAYSKHKRKAPVGVGWQEACSDLLHKSVHVVRGARSKHKRKVQEARSELR